MYVIYMNYGNKVRKTKKVSLTFSLMASREPTLISVSHLTSLQIKHDYIMGWTQKREMGAYGERSEQKRAARLRCVCLHEVWSKPSRRWKNIHCKTETQRLPALNINTSALSGRG